MATSDILGLFMSPEQYQAQQLAQQQANEQARAINFANLDPRGQANYGVFLGAQQLGRGFAGLLGVQDPQLQRIRQRQEIMQTINPADPESLMAGIQRASQMGDQELALTLADYTRKAQGDLALARQRQAQADRERVQSQSGGIQEAARIRQIVLDQANLDPESNEYKALEAEKIELQNVVKNKTTDRVQQLKNLYAELDDAKKRAAGRAAPSATVGLDGQAFATRPQVNVEDDPEVRAIQSLIRVATGEKPAKEVAAPDAVRTAEAYADSISDDRKSQEWKDAFQSQLQKKDGDKTFEPLVRAERIGVLTDELAALETNNQKNTPQYRRKAAELKSLQGDKAGAPIKELVLGEEIAKLDAFIRNAKDPAAPDVIDAKTKVKLYRDAMKRERPNLDTLGLAKGGKYDGQPVFLDENTRKTFVFDTDKTGNQIEVPYTGGLKGLKGGTEVNVGGSVVKVDTSETGKAAGKELGKELITVKDKQSAIDSIRDAISILDQGIYAGSYSAIRKGLAKYAGVGDPDKVARTEEFVSYIGDVVVARLKDFGGNDSEQELAYLNKIIGGDLEVEPKALKRILERAEAKIQRGIERLRRQAESGEKKESLTTTLAPDEGGAQTPAPKPTMRYNPTTKKLERIK